MGNTAYAAITGFGSTSSTFDDFNGSSVDTSKWEVEQAGTTATVGESDNELTVNLDGAASAYGAAFYGGVSWRNAVDLTDSSVQVHLANTSAAETSGAGFTFWLSTEQGIPGENGLTVAAVMFTLETGTLFSRYVDSSGTVSNNYSAAWNSANTWLQISEASGTITFSTSPDGSTWTEFSTISVADFISDGGQITSLYPALQGYYYYSSPDVNLTFGFGSFSIGATPTPAIPAVTASVVVVDDTGAFVEEIPELIANFTPGTSSEDVISAVVSAVQAALSDTTVEVRIIGV